MHSRHQATSKSEFMAAAKVASMNAVETVAYLESAKTYEEVAPFMAFSANTHRDREPRYLSFFLSSPGYLAICYSPRPAN